MFIDEQIKGDFKMMKHEHHFKPCENGTIMIDLVEFRNTLWYLWESVQQPLSHLLYKKTDRAAE